MEHLLKRFGVDMGSVRLAYALGKDQGRKFVKGALIFPGIRVADLERRAAMLEDSPAELIKKRDKMIEGILDFVDEFVNLDED